MCIRDRNGIPFINKLHCILCLSRPELKLAGQRFDNVHLLSLPCFLFLLKFFIDKVINVAIHDGIHIPCLCAGSVILDHGVRPVSYTHLDVYKRQAFKYNISWRRYPPLAS